MVAAVAIVAGTPVMTAAGAEVYRCEKDGVVTYTDKPCSKSAKPIEIKKPMVLPPGPTVDLAKQARERDRQGREARDKADAAWLELHEAQKAEDERLRSARVHGDVVIGMSPADVRRLHGEPAVVSHRSGKSGDAETWSYVLGSGERLHVTFVGGRVSAVSTRKDKK